MSALRHGLFFCFIFLTGCGAAEPRWATDAAILRASYTPSTKPEVRLYTVVSTRNGSGAHSSLLITTQRERILFDPAGTFSVASLPERNDVHHGMTPRALRLYVDYHARETFDVIEQRLPVTPKQAAMIAERAKSYGAVPDAHCALSINRVLQAVPGFERMRPTYFPNATRAQFGALEGVQARVFKDDDPDANAAVLAEADL